MKTRIRRWKKKVQEDRDSLALFVDSDGLVRTGTQDSVGFIISDEQRVMLQKAQRRATRLPDGKEKVHPRLPLFASAFMTGVMICADVNVGECINTSAEDRGTDLPNRGREVQRPESGS